MATKNEIVQPACEAVCAALHELYETDLQQSGGGKNPPDKPVMVTTHRYST